MQASSLYGPFFKAKKCYIILGGVLYFSFYLQGELIYTVIYITTN